MARRRLRWDRWNGWYCIIGPHSVWGYRTPWGAWHGCRRLKRSRG